ncbi:unnamed protein product [Hymenolepis diminuta]|uniref:Uncharacterized protein n=1 Tax=Hymenolepis diminuta TaxID=6216 RepID=A0A564Y047_HYMDI|nr:unnamed protein product [Hymenolepis diminuta]
MTVTSTSQKGRLFECLMPNYSSGSGLPAVEDVVYCLGYWCGNLTFWKISSILWPRPSTSANFLPSITNLGNNTDRRASGCPFPPAPNELNCHYIHLPPFLLLFPPL